ncbi:MAG: T9SS type A sorting domain-containing protein [Flavobacteriales bacterium]
MLQLQSGGVRGRDLLSGAQVQVLGGSNVLLSVEGATLMNGMRQGLSTGNGAACTEDLTIELRTDDAPEETSWEILDQQSSAIVCTGSGGYPASSYVTENCCLPIGCYRLRVLDAGGDGINAGGYVLRNTGNQERIIDDRDNFSTGSTSAISGAAGFCLPIGTDRTIFSSCDKLDWVSNKFIVATENPAVSAQLGLTNTTSGYEFWFFDPNGTYSFRRFRSHATSDGYGTGATRACHFKINRWTHSALTPHLPAEVLLNVRIRGRAAGTNFEFGPACRFKIDPALAACPHIQLQDNPLSSDYSCGVNKVFGGSNSSSNRITAIPPRPIPTVSSAQVRYQFRFRVPGEGICIVRPMQTSATMYLNWSNGEQLRCGTPYEVDVRTSVDGGSTWCAGGTDPVCDPSPGPWGVVCQVNITSSTYCPGNVVEEQDAQARQQETEVTLYPNPTTGDPCYLTLRGIDGSIANVQIQVFDLSGKVISRYTIPLTDGQLSTRTDLAAGLSSGVYLVQVEAGDRSFSERMVVRND